MRFVSYQLEDRIALQVWGKEGAFLHSRARDRQLNDAIEIIKRADTPEALFTLADQAGGVQTATGAGASASGTPGLN